MSLRDWVFVVGVIVILLVSLSAMPDAKKDWYNPEKRKKEASAAHGFYITAVFDLICIVTFFSFRRGLAMRLGVADPWSWVLAPIGLILILAISTASWIASYGANSDNYPKWLWVVLLLAELAAAFGYLTVAFGLASWTS